MISAILMITKQSHFLITRESFLKEKRKRKKDQAANFALSLYTNCVQANFHWIYKILIYGSYINKKTMLWIWAVFFSENVIKEIIDDLNWRKMKELMNG